VTEDGEEIDPRDELVQKLLEYKMYKYMSYELRDREEDASCLFYKKPTIPDEVKAYREPVDLDELLSGVTLAKLHALYRDILRRQEDRVDPVRSKFGNLKREEVDISATMQFVERYITEKKHCSFRELLTQKAGKTFVIVTFLTILEFIKEGKVEVDQTETFGDIQIVYTGKEGETADTLSDYD
jgi:segregation and condensation protein A